MMMCNEKNRWVKKRGDLQQESAYFSPLIRLCMARIACSMTGAARVAL